MSSPLSEKGFQLPRNVETAISLPSVVLASVLTGAQSTLEEELSTPDISTVPYSTFLFVVPLRVESQPTGLIKEADVSLYCSQVASITVL